MENQEIIRIYSLMSTHQDLLRALYVHFFANNAEVRNSLPRALVENAQNKPLGHLGSDETSKEALAEMQARVVLNLQCFLDDAEKIVQHFQGVQEKTDDRHGSTPPVA